MHNYGTSPVLLQCVLVLVVGLMDILHYISTYMCDTPMKVKQCLACYEQQIWIHDTVLHIFSNHLN
jgi:hypothetical protein